MGRIFWQVLALKDFRIIDLVQVQIGSRMFDQTFVITLLT